MFRLSRVGLVLGALLIFSGWNSGADSLGTAPLRVLSDVADFGDGTSPA